MLNQYLEKKPVLGRVKSDMKFQIVTSFVSGLYLCDGVYKRVCVMAVFLRLAALPKYDGI